VLLISFATIFRIVFYPLNRYQHSHTFANLRKFLPVGKMVQVVDHLGTMDVKDSNGNDQTLEQWYEGYLENNTLPAPVSDELKHDTLDTDLYHKGFQDQESDVQVSNDLCEKCQNLANNLVTMLPHIEEEGAGPQFIPQYSSCHEFYVRSRAGCHSCKVLMQLVQDRFMYFLKAERRLRYLKEEWAINLILKEQTTPERHLKLFINLPGIEVPMYWFGNDLTLSQTEDSRCRCSVLLLLLTFEQ